MTLENSGKIISLTEYRLERQKSMEELKTQLQNAAAEIFGFYPKANQEQYTTIEKLEEKTEGSTKTIVAVVLMMSGRIRQRIIVSWLGLDGPSTISNRLGKEISDQQYLRFGPVALEIFEEDKLRRTGGGD